MHLGRQGPGTNEQGMMMTETHQGLNGLSWVIISHGLLGKLVINTKLLFSHLQNGNNNTYPTSDCVKFYDECKEPNLELGICQVFNE